MCFLGKHADIIIMEIMSFVSSTERTRFQNRARTSHKSAGKKFFSFFTGQKAKKRVEYNEMDFSFDAQYDIPISLQTPFTEAEKRSTTSGVANFFKGNALFFLFLIISVCASMALAYYLNTIPRPADTLVFPESISENDTALLNAAMSNFLTNSGESLDFESPLSEDFTEKLSVLFSEPVTYSNYTVKSGENLTNIAKKFGLQNIGSIISVNNITNVRKLRSGQKLLIPSMDGIMHKITKHDTLSSISSKYNVSIENLVDVNNLDSEQIFPGETIFISGARMSQQDLKKALGEVWSFPLPRASFQRISSRYGWRRDPFTGARSFHTGIDLVARQGTPIRAALDGRVVVAGWSNVYGNYVILDHGNGYQTLYAHMVRYSVRKGQYVSQDAQIGQVGNTGYSTGAHLHFTVYKHGKLIDPSGILPRVR